MQFKDLLEQYGISIASPNHHHSRNGWINFDCPFCSPNSNRYRMGFNILGRYCNCWACGRHHLFEVVQEITKLSAKDVIKTIKELEPSSNLSSNTTTSTRGKLVLPKGLGSLSKAHVDYLHKVRNFAVRELQQLWEIRGIEIHPRLSWRIFIPIFYNGTMVSWTTRSISDSENVCRYIAASPEEEVISHKTLLYGEDYCRNAIIVCEGPTDVWRIGPGAVCTFGATFSSAQVEKISKYPLRVVCFDNEPAAQRQAKQLCSMLEVFPGDTYNVVLESKDPDSASESELNKLRSFLD